MRIQRPLFLTILLFCVLAVAIVPTLAQSTCPIQVETALAALGNNCTAMGRNSACYGNTRVEATFAADVPPDFFTRVADQTDLTTLDTIQTAELDTVSGEWGIAVMNVQANVPNSVPGQAVTFLLLGDAEVENQVAPDEAFHPVDPIDVTVVSDVSLRISPDLNAPSGSTVPTGTTLLADGQSNDGSWLRVFFENNVQWVSTELVTTQMEIGALPIISEDTRTSMQAFYFTTGIGISECYEAPNVLAVRSPNNISVDLSVNGADIRIGSLITFQTVSTGVLATVVEGHMEIAGGIIVPAGQAVTASVERDGTINQWDAPRASTPDEIALGQLVQRAMFTISTPAPVSDGTTASTGTTTTVSTTTSTCTAGDVVLHTVSAGENLFRIALRYDSTVSDIAALNSIVNVRAISTGQQLNVPCGSRASTEPPMGDASTVQVQPLSGGAVSVPGSNSTLNCATLRQTSPTGTFPNGLAQFFWDGVTGATNYRVVIYDGTGAPVAILFTPGTQTSIVGDMSDAAVGVGRTFGWSVDALVNGAVACSSGALTLQRDEFPQSSAPPINPVTCVAGPYCNCDSVCQPSFPNYENNLTCPTECP